MEMENKKYNWIEYNLYLLPFRKIVCFMVGHSWFYHEGDVNSESFERECLRCGRAEALLVVNQNKGSE